jgi:hypothetical protein
MLTVVLYRGESKLPAEVFTIADGDHVSHCPLPDGLVEVQVRLRSMVDVYFRLREKDYFYLVKAIANSVRAPLAVDLREASQ